MPNSDLFTLIYYISHHLTWWRMCMFRVLRRRSERVSEKESENDHRRRQEMLQEKYLNTFREMRKVLLDTCLNSLWHGIWMQLERYIHSRVCNARQTRWKIRERVSEMLLIEISSVLFSECHFSRARLNQTRAKTNKTSKLIKQIIRKKMLQEKLSWNFTHEIACQIFFLSLLNIIIRISLSFSLLQAQILIQSR
jgi:hypothetical protein